MKGSFWGKKENMPLLILRGYGNLNSTKIYKTKIL